MTGYIDKDKVWCPHCLTQTPQYTGRLGNNYTECCPDADYDRLVEIVRWLLECPYNFDAATIPKSKELDLPQVVVEMSVAYQIIIELKEAIDWDDRHSL